MIVETLVPGGIIAGLLLTVRYLRHHPRNFHRHFPGFQPALATHRGYGKHAAIPENTLLAFRSSEKLGFRAHELDVRRTKDGEIMLLHGPRLEETTSGTGRMEEASSFEISTLDAAHYLHREHPQAKHRFEKVPTLSEVLEAIHPEALINVEIKRDRWDFSYGLEEQTLRIVLASSARNRVFLSGFHFLTIWRLKRMRCPIPVGLLVEPGLFTHAKNWLYRFILLPDNIHLHESRESAGYMRRLKRRGFGLAFWTVNDLAQVRRLFEQGADVVITDRMEFIEHFAPKKARSPGRRAQRKPSRTSTARR
ncbi:MAG: glycerophosphodiester phosphodiesterase family protein [Turneriella sp.]